MAESKAPSGIGKAWKFFGKLPGQTLTEFKIEWNELDEESMAQITAGLSGDEPSLTYTPTAEQVKEARAQKIDVPVGV